MYMAHERRQYILRLLESRGSIRSATLASELGVTDETIRTDLVALQKMGLLKRVHGGAEYTVPTGANAPTAEKRADVAMAKLLAAHIRQGSRIYAEPCAFTRILAQVLQDKHCTFLTCSAQQVLHLAPKALPHEIICCGGTLDKETKLFREDVANVFFNAHPPDFAILRPPALKKHQAAYHSTLQAQWAKAAATIAEKCIVVVPSAHLWTEADYGIALPSYHLITEDNIPADFQGISLQTIPYISADLFANDDEFVF